MQTKSISEIILEEVLKINNRIDSLEVRMEKGFKMMEEKFKEIDERFAQIDARFLQIDARFEQIDRRFEKIEARLTRIDKTLYEIAEINMRTGLKFDETEERIVALELGRI